MTVSEFLTAHNLCPEQIPGEACLGQLLQDMAQGLAGKGPIPMLPSYLSAAVTPPRNASCCVLDAGGTNLRAARAEFDSEGNCRISGQRAMPMPGTLAPMEADTFYQTIADLVRQVENAERIGFCFSYNLLLERDLDGILRAWCKEVQVPGALGTPVGASLNAALGGGHRIHMLNDSVAAMLGASTPAQAVQVGIILGTGINVCYEERTEAIPKISQKLNSGSMIISTEVGEFDGIPKSDFDLSLFAATEDPALAHGEKQCAGGYLGELICRVWTGAVNEGLLPKEFENLPCSLREISDLLDAHPSPIPRNGDAIAIARTLIRRSAKIAAILCAGPILRCTAPGESVNIAVEGSQFGKLSGFRAHFCRELDALLAPYGIRQRMVQTENACLKGAALAAFARPM